MAPLAPTVCPAWDPVERFEVARAPSVAEPVALFDLALQSAGSPNVDFQRFTYNANSQIVLTETGTRIDGVETVARRGQVEYDELGRVRTLRGNAGQAATTTYDDIGNPISITDATGRTGPIATTDSDA